MSTASRRRAGRRRAGHRRVPAFAPVPLRARADGWTPARQAAFLGALAETGSVCAAARRVGMRRETAYRLRARPGAGSFAAAWDQVTGRLPPGRRKVTAEELAVRALHGLLKPVIYRGRHVATIEKADNSALLRFLTQVDRARPDAAATPPGARGFTPRAASTSPRKRTEGPPPARDPSATLHAPSADRP